MYLIHLLHIYSLNVYRVSDYTMYEKVNPRIYMLPVSEITSVGESSIFYLFYIYSIIGLI